MTGVVTNSPEKTTKHAQLHVFAAIFFCGWLSGGAWGIAEAIWRLAGSANGFYDALFWGYCFYGVLGGLCGCIIYPLDRLWSHRFSLSLRWSVYSCILFLGILCWVLPNWIVVLVIPFWIWLSTILLTRSPLKIVLSLKGGWFLSGVLFILSGVFSLTTGPVQRPLKKPESYEQLKNNILILAIEGLRTEDLHNVAPSIADLRARSLRFDQTYRDSMDPQKAMIAMLGGQHRWLYKDIDGEFLSLAEILLEEGYHTVAVVNDLQLGYHSGLDQGFEEYYFLPAHSPLPFTEGARRLKLIGVCLRFWAYIGQDPGRYHRSSAEVLSRLQQSIQKFGEENWFAYVQIRELEPPFFFEEEHGFRRAAPNEEHRAYQERLQRLDGSLGSFWGKLGDISIKGNTIVVMVSTKALTFKHEPPRFNVPFSIFVPHRQAQSIQHEAQLIDLSPTLASLLSLPRQFWNGIDLLHDPNMRYERPIVSHTPQGWSMIQYEGWRYMLDARNGEGRLYNIERDPEQRYNLWEERPLVRDRLQNVFQEQPR